MPEHIEAMFDECEDSSDIIPVLRRASKVEAGWLARFTRDHVEKEREMLQQELERELQVRMGPNHSSCNALTKVLCVRLRVLRAMCATSASC